MKVPGRKTIPKIEIVFMAELSRLLSRAIVLITALSSLLALAMTAEVSARLRFVLASLAAMNWNTLDAEIRIVLVVKVGKLNSQLGSDPEHCS
jgi:hypothetical protein